MATNNPINRLTDLVAEDPDVRQAAKLLALQALEQAEFLLLNGNDDIQMKIITMMAPTFRKATDEKQSADSQEVTRQKRFDRFIRELEEDDVDLDDTDDTDDTNGN